MAAERMYLGVVPFNRPTVRFASPGASISTLYPVAPHTILNVNAKGVWTALEVEWAEAPGLLREPQAGTSLTGEPIWLRATVRKWNP